MAKQCIGCRKAEFIIPVTKSIKLKLSPSGIYYLIGSDTIKENALIDKIGDTLWFTDEIYPLKLTILNRKKDLNETIKSMRKTIREKEKLLKKLLISNRKKSQWQTL